MQRNIIFKSSIRPKNTSLNDHLVSFYNKVRDQTLKLSVPLSEADQCIQSMPDASPTKWHLAHTTWFFETFILKRFVGDYQEFHPNYNFLFNSYYEQIGDRHARPERGMITRPSSAEVYEYRDHVDKAMRDYFQTKPKSDVLQLIELGINHEQQHQELLITDIKHALSRNPLYPVYIEHPPTIALSVSETSWTDHPGGLVEIGYSGKDFIFDAEGPRHKIWLEPFQFAKYPVSNREYINFIEDDGYKRAEFWLSDGWVMCQKENWKAPMYWHKNDDGTWSNFTMSGMRPINLNAPVCHVSYYEADAFARWINARLPREAEWEIIANSYELDGHFADANIFDPQPSTKDGVSQIYGDVWEWTQSSFNAYPGYHIPEGAIGEYNGKFMSGQMVLRGGSCATPSEHIRASYRNFFPPSARWQFSGIRLAKDKFASTTSVYANDNSNKDIFLDHVISGLGKIPKRTSSKYLYDLKGAQLFEKICKLDVYYPTKTEIEILNKNAIEIAKYLGSDVTLIEYGSGSLEKVRILLDSLNEPVSLCAIDISEEQLQDSARIVRKAYPKLEVLTVASDFTSPLKIPVSQRIPKSKVAFFPGSTIGNFEPADATVFLQTICKTVGKNGKLLIGVDLKKDHETLIKAYDDKYGITEAFNKNLLSRINQELGADFNLNLFRHIARYNIFEGRIEMHLESCIDQAVSIGERKFFFSAGETIHTENSYKYHINEFIELVALSGFKKIATWTDKDNLFAVMLFEVN